MNILKSMLEEYYELLDCSMTEDAENILNDELGNKVVHMISKTMVLCHPGYYFDNQELREWHHCSISTLTGIITFLERNLSY